MAMKDLESFSGKEIARVYIAGTVAEAKAIETLLNDKGVDYFIELEEFTRSGFNLMGSTYVGATFYVLSDQAQFCRTFLKEQGFGPGIPED